MATNPTTTDEVIDGLDAAELADTLEYADQLRKSKPTNENGLVQYIWRMCRFHSGADPSMPVTATWWLQDYLDEQDIDVSVTGILDENGKEFLRELDSIADDTLRHMGYDPAAAAKRWEKAGLI